MKQNEIIKWRLWAYIALILMASLFGLAWKFKLLMPKMLLFMSNWGAHGLMAFFFVVLIILFYNVRGYNINYNKHTIYVCMGALLYCWMDEFLQNFQTGRVADIWDAVAEFVGVAFAYSCIRLIGPIHRR